MKRALLAALAFSAACTSNGDGGQPVIVPSLVFPRTLPSSVAQLVVSVYEGNNGQVTCDTTTGLTNVTNQTPITTATLTKCPSGTGFCGTLGVPENANTRIFAATGCSAGGACTATAPNRVAVGCASAVLNQDAEPLSITMYRFIAPSNCGDGTVQPTETCDDSSAVCKSCQTIEQQMSVASSAAGTVAGKVGDKYQPSFLFPQGGNLFAFFTDKTGGNSGTQTNDLAMSSLTGSLLPVSTPAILTSGEIYSPMDMNTFPPTPLAGSQSAPSAAILGSKTYEVYQDDQFGNGLDIHLRSWENSSFVCDQLASAPVAINGKGAGEAGAQGSPSVAAYNGNLFVAWVDTGSGAINGIEVTEPGNTLGALQQTISTGSGNAGVKLASAPKGWLAVWQSNTDIATRGIDGTTGNFDGLQTLANTTSGATYDHPGIAALSDGRYAVVWHGAAGIFMQRYDNSEQPIANDQAAPINNLVADGNQSEPSIAAIDTASVKGYAIVWTDGTSGHIRARYADAANGFLFNNTTGQSDEFQVSVTDGRTRGAPTVAVGGSGFVVFGWEDRTASAPGPGIVGRRFPLPPTQ